MVNPQKEDGYVPIANELVEQFAKLNLCAYEWRTLWVLWRKTWGWHKKQDQISVTQFQKLKGLDRPHQYRSLKSLQEKGIVGTYKGTSNVVIYYFIKDYAKWKGVAGRGDGAQLGNKKAPQKAIIMMPNKAITKDNKETKQKKGNTAGRFTPPTVEQIRQYCDERGNSIDPERFFDFYEAKGWMIGKNKMKNWKAAVRTWESHNNARQERSVYKEFKG